MYIFNGDPINPAAFGPRDFSETDFVVLGPNGVFIVEAKNYGGSITGNAADERLTQIKGHGKHTHEDTFYNPLRQVSTHIGRLGQRLRKAGYPVWVSGAVAFTGSAVVSIAHVCDIPVFSGENLSALPNYILNFRSEGTLSAAEQQRIVQLLKQECNANYPHVQRVKEREAARSDH